MLSNRASVTFRDDLPIPTTNMMIYEHVYVLEQWLRRVAYASLVATAGASWETLLPDELARRLERGVAALEDRVHLHTDTNKNIIWTMAIGQLQQVLSLGSIAAAVRTLTGLGPALISAKLDELRVIRNIVGHNRSTTDATHTIVLGIAAALEPAIYRFRMNTLYEYDGRASALFGKPQGVAEAVYQELEHDNDWERWQPVLWTSSLFHSLTCLPVEGSENLALLRYLELSAPVSDHLLATQVNLDGSEFSIVWPVQAPDEMHERTVRWFFSLRETVEWTTTPYDLQSANAVCDPLIWFYDNEKPRRE